jgi:hypothetical protein
MRGMIGMLLCATVLAAQADAPRNFPVERNETGLRAADHAQLLAARTRDADALDWMMHAKFAVSSPEGEIWPRQKVLAMWRNRGIGHDHFERTVENVILVKNVGVVSGHELVQPSTDSVAGQRRHDGGQSVRRRYTNVWLWDDGRWWFLARHANEASASTP